MPVGLALVRQDYEDYPQREGGRGEAERAGISGGIDIDTSLEKDLLWTKAGKTEGLTEETLFATSSLVAAVGFELPVSKNRYVEVLRTVAEETQSKHSLCKATTRRVDAKNAKMEELEIKVGSLEDKAEKVSREAAAVEYPY